MPPNGGFLLPIRKHPVKRLLLLALMLMIAPALAQTTGAWTMYKGSSAVRTPQYSYTSNAECRAAALAKDPAGTTYTCRATIIDTIVSVGSVAVPPQPAPETQTVQCASPPVGSWTQTRTYSWNGTSWVAGAWLPSEAPIGTCTSVPANPYPNGETQAVQCVSPALGTWTQTRTYTLSGATWVAGAWSPSTAPAGACTTPVTTTGTTASLLATRTSGTAPLAVLFDASGTAITGKDSFREATYAFDFGDERGLNWAVSGKPKNSEVGGPLAAHVYDVPGTYTATVAVNGVVASVKITVADPASVYSGTRTICVGSDFSGCPADAARQSALPTDGAWNGKRVLLQRGATFGVVSILDPNAGVQVGAYGSGAKPIVASVNVGNWRPSSANFATDITVMDLAVKDGVQQGLGSRVLMYRLDVSGGSGQLMMTFGEIDFWYRGDQYRTVPQSAFYNTREIFYVENNAIGNGTQFVGFWGDGSRIALLGNRVGYYQQHSARFSALDRAVIAHNEMQGRSADGMRVALKLHGMGLNAYSDASINDTSGTGGWASSKIVIANNLFGNAADNNDWTVAIAPQNDVYAEGVENVIVENNRFIRGTKTSTDLVIGGRKITTRKNTLPSGAAISIGPDNGALPSAWTGPNYAQ